MQLRTLVLILFALIVVAARAAEGRTPAQADPSVLKQGFLKLSGLKEGPIELIDGSEDCRVSTLRVIEIDDATLTLSLGANPLVTGIGANSVNYSERGCRVEEKATTASRSVTFRKTQTCGDGIGKLEYAVDVAVSAEGFRFTRVNRRNGKITLNLACKYRFL